MIIIVKLLEVKWLELVTIILTRISEYCYLRSKLCMLRVEGNDQMITVESYRMNVEVLSNVQYFQAAYTC